MLTGKTCSKTDLNQETDLGREGAGSSSLCHVGLCNPRSITRCNVNNHHHITGISAVWTQLPASKTGNQTQQESTPLEPRGTAAILTFTHQAPHLAQKPVMQMAESFGALALLQTHTPRDEQTDRQHLEQRL